MKVNKVELDPMRVRELEAGCRTKIGGQTIVEG